MPDVQLMPIPGLPLINTGDDLPTMIAEAIQNSGLILYDGDVVVVTSKIVSKSEGRWVDLNTVIPNEAAQQVAAQCNKDPREVTVILGESKRVSRIHERGVLITEHKLGFICANAGIDHSNTRPDGEWRLLLPENPDESAHQLRKALSKTFNASIAVIISDSHGRPFRMGTVGVAIGSAGLPALWDLRGTPDLFGHRLEVTDVGFADELAAAAGLVMGQAAESQPVVIIRGVNYPVDDQSTAAALVRPAEMDLYR